MVSKTSPSDLSPAPAKIHDIKIISALRGANEINAYGISIAISTSRRPLCCHEGNSNFKKESEMKIGIRIILGLLVFSSVSFAADFILQPGAALRVGDDLVICAGAVEAKGHCAAHDPYDTSAVDVCNSQFKNKKGCAAHSYFCKWVTGGTCRARNPSDSAAVGVCNSQASNKSGCQAQGYFCEWVE